MLGQAGFRKILCGFIGVGLHSTLGQGTRSTRRNSSRVGTLCSFNYDNGGWMSKIRSPAPAANRLVSVSVLPAADHRILDADVKD